MPTTWKDVVASVRNQMPKGTSLKDILPAASAEWKRIKAGKHPTKGMASLTMPGKKDFTTKKSSKVFHRKGHYESESADGVKRQPYHKKRGSRKTSKLNNFTMAGGQQAESVETADEMENVSDIEERIERAEDTGAADVHDEETVISSPGMPPMNGEEAQSGGRRHKKMRTARKSYRRHSNKHKRGGRRHKKIRTVRKSSRRHNKLY